MAVFCCWQKQRYNVLIQARKINLSSFRNNPKFIQVGSGNITYQTQGSGGGGVTITFSEPFDNPPVVIASTKGPYSANVIEVHVQSPSTTGFSILGRTAGGAAENGSFQWVAIDLQALSIA